MAGSIVQLALALYLATILSFKTKGGNFFKGLMFFPYLISGIAIGFIFKYFYTRGFVFDTILGWCGFDLESLPYWLKTRRSTTGLWLQHLSGDILVTIWFFSLELLCL